MASVAGPDGHDIRQFPARAPIDFLAALDAGTDLGGLRIGLLVEGFDPARPTGVDRAVQTAAAALQSNGASVERVSVPQHVQIPDAYSALTVEGAAMLLHTNWLGAFSAGYVPERLSAAIGAMIARHGDELPPNMKLDPLDALESTVFGGRAGAQLVGIGRNTLPFNYTGHPALSIPCGTDDEGMPIGMQLVTRRGRDDVLVRVARCHENRTGEVAPRPHRDRPHGLTNTIVRQ